MAVHTTWESGRKDGGKWRRLWEVLNAKTFGLCVRMQWAIREPLRRPPIYKEGGRRADVRNRRIKTMSYDAGNEIKSFKTGGGHQCHILAFRDIRRMRAERTGEEEGEAVNANHSCKFDKRNSRS